MNGETPVEKKLNDFLNAASDPQRLTTADWHRFYDFVVAAYQVSREKRPRISQLSDYLRDYRFENPGQLAVLYAHGLYILARSDGKAIYGEDFNP